LKPLFEIELDRTGQSSRNVARWLRAQLKAAIADGRLPPGAKLPAARQAQAVFGVSRNTLAEVYDGLLNEGCVVARRGAGTFVATPLPAAPARSGRKATGTASYRLNEFWLRPEVTAAMGFWRDPPVQPASRRAPAIDLRPALVDPRLFPHAVFRRVTAKQLRTLERKPASYRSPQGNQGNYHLRTAITQHIALTRAVACHADDVLVTSGAQQAFDLLARVLVVPGKTVVAVEDPGYPPMRVAFAAAGAKLVPVSVDAEGLRVDALPADVGVICLCPSHQFPLGVTMSARRRRALVQFARKHRAVIVEDDYDGEFRFGDEPLAALRTADAADVVFYVGTFSKCMLPTLRLGFVVAPEWALPTLIAAKNCLDWHCPTPLQRGVAAFIDEGHLTRHVRKMRQLYQQRRERVLDRLEADFGEWLAPIPSQYGMHVSADARVPLDLHDATQALLRANVKLHDFSRYFLGEETRQGLVFGFGSVDLPAIDRGLTALRKVLLSK
jgi:GntR family transcriptional regulator/MocR family aminotransferase